LHGCEAAVATQCDGLTAAAGSILLERRSKPQGAA
jgi:hypothetical protein